VTQKWVDPPGGGNVAEIAKMRLVKFLNFDFPLVPPPETIFLG